MPQNQSLSAQEVADILHVSKSTIYDLIRKGEIHSYRVGRKVRFTQDDVDAYIARSRSEHSTLPVKKVDTYSTLLTPDPDIEPDLIISGQDVILDLLAYQLRQYGINVGRTYLNSFEGLLSLYQGNVTAAACHLYDGRDYNRSYVQRLMPGVPALLINISYRTQGFYVRKGNPKGIKGWNDLKRTDINILNRRPGSSSRILLDIQLQKLGVPASSVPGYDRIMNSHLTMASAIADGEADLALGTERISRQIDGIGFIPLQEERYDLVIRKEDLDLPETQKLIQVLRSDIFRTEIKSYSGNNYRDLGKLVCEV